MQALFPVVGVVPFKAYPPRPNPAVGRTVTFLTPAGLYFYRIEAGDHRATGRVTRLR